MALPARPALDSSGTFKSVDRPSMASLCSSTCHACATVRRGSTTRCACVCVCVRMRMRVCVRVGMYSGIYCGMMWACICTDVRACVWTCTSGPVDSAPFGTLVSMWSRHVRWCPKSYQATVWRINERRARQKPTGGYVFPVLLLKLLRWAACAQTCV